ncbi:hypothetical protein EON65_29375, partial [archaeon]
MDAFIPVIFLLIMVILLSDHQKVQAAPRKNRNKRSSKRAPLKTALPPSVNLTAHTKESQPVDIAGIVAEMGSDSAIEDVRFKSTPAKELAGTSLPSAYPPTH